MTFQDLPNLKLNVPKQSTTLFWLNTTKTGRCSSKTIGGAPTRVGWYEDSNMDDMAGARAPECIPCYIRLAAVTQMDKGI